MRARGGIVAAVLVVAVTALVQACGGGRAVLDAARRAGLTPADFPEVAVDVFRGMDGGVTLTPEEVKGRNTWLLWTAGNEAFWDYLANNSFGTVDFLKTLDSRQRGRRFAYYGLTNEPGMRRAAAPDRYGLWLDEPEGPPAGLDPRVYGRSSGVLGLRLFDNPAFDAEARRRWNPARYYSDPAYYLDPKLVRPYRVGMACAFCHVGPDPVRPPADPEAPGLENVSSYVGSQYFWIGRIFLHDLKEDNFVWQWFNSSAPGSLDTSLIATDNVNNPRTMNAIYEVGARLAVAVEEDLGPPALLLPGARPRMPVPHVLKDGADSVGILAALGRVYVNIGSYHEEWVRHFNLLVGGQRQTPFTVENARAHSVYWLATESRLENLARFFLKAARPHRLADAPGGRGHLTTDEARLTRGKLAFADHCAGCHSSKQPPPDAAPGSTAYLEWMRREVVKPDFLEGNFLSTDRRIPVSEVKTNACAALATNALRGHIWDNFSSETYKGLPAAGPIEVHHPLDGTPRAYPMPGGGRGYYRVPSLVSMWASAPYFHNNALGRFTNDPSVAGRLAAFEDAAEKLLWPEKRRDSDCATRWGMPFCPPVYRTTRSSWIVVNRVFLPRPLQVALLEPGETELRIGPIPKGTPVSLLANVDGELSLEPARIRNLVEVVLAAKRALKRIEREGLGETEATQVLRGLVPNLLDVSKCPDFVVDRGHEYGRELPDDDKRALIAFLKTL